MKRGGRLRVMKFLAHLLLMSLLGIKSGCSTEKVRGPNWDSSMASEAPQCGAVYAVPQSRIQPISSGPEFSDYEEPNREHSQHINPGDEKRVAQLCIENTTLLKGLTDISHKFNKAVVDNRILRSDVEALLLSSILSNSMVS
ncbi:unnamed protein product [Sphagnum balticum]